MIPKRMFYVWFGGAPLPQQVVENLETWRQLNPDYEIIEINEQNYDVTKIPFVADAYRAKKWAFASDVARLDVLYRRGGFYFDTDVKLLKSLEPLRKYQSVWAMETSGVVNSGLIVGAQKGDQNLRELLAIYGQLQFDPSRVDDFITTDILSRHFRHEGLQEKNKFQRLEDGTVVFQSSYFAPFHWWGGGRISRRTIAVQQYAKSWGQGVQVRPYRRFKLELRHHAPVIFKLGQVLRGTRSHEG